MFDVSTALGGLYRSFLLISDVIVILVGISALYINKNRNDIVIAISFFVIAAISTLIINREGLVMMFNGARDFFGIIFIVPYLRFLMTFKGRGDDFIRLFDKSLFFFLWVQVFFATWQFLRYGAGDSVGGTSGSSGTLSMLIYFISFYLMSKRWDEHKNYFKNLYDNKVLIFLLYPSFINETKISFILFLFYFLLLIKFNRAAIAKILVALPLMTIILIGIGAVYLDVTNQEADRLTSKEFYDEYLFGGDDLETTLEIAFLVQDGTIDVTETSNHWAVDIPRFAKLFLMPQIMEDSKGGMIFGAGLGQFKGGESLEMSQFAKENQWLLRGSRLWLFMILVELGFVGLAWYVFAMIKIVNWKECGYPMAKNVKIYFLLFVVIILFYHEAWRYLLFCSIFIYIILNVTMKPYGCEDEK